jgi:ribosomal protein S18 acetylase RimI-like enzyme
LGVPDPRPATEARPDVLLSLVHGVRQALIGRGESISSAWTEEAATDLRAGRQLGWTIGENSLAFSSTRPSRSFGHVHVEGDADRLDRAETLLALLVTHLPDSVRRLDAGVSGLSEAEETELAVRFARAEGATVLQRARMERPVPPAIPGSHLPDPPGVGRRAVREIPLPALTELDWRSFQGTPDENLVADTPAEDEQSLVDVMSGKLGGFLDAASTALVREDGALLGALLTAEHDARTAVFLDLLVEPSARRHGLGRFLVLWGLRALSALGYTTARLWVTEANRPAWRLYESMGFAVAGRARIFRYARPDSAGQPQTPR